MRLDLVRLPVPQTPAEASQEASLKIQPPQGAERPCYEAATPLAVENGVGKLAAPRGCAQCQRGKESMANSQPPICLRSVARLDGGFLFAFPLPNPALNRNLNLNLL